MRAMKDSGIEWIGQIPREWEITKIGMLYNLRITKVSDTDYLPLSVTKIGVLPQLETVAKTNAHDDRKLVKKGDFVINSRSDRRGSCGISNYNGSVSLINIVLKPKNNMNSGYYSWLFKTAQFADEFYKNGHGIVDDLWTTTWPDMKRIVLSVPKYSEQQQIANFLDTKCSEIDATAKDIQKEISLLEEYKKAVITEAVTKGLNPDAEMKDSGMKWLPQIPKHWQVIPSKYLFANSDIRRQNGDEQLTASQKYGIITQKEYTAKENAQVVLATQGLEKWKHVEPYDFIISLRSFQGGLEMSEITGCITWHYVVLKAQKEIYHPYYKWLFKSARYINALQGTCNFIRDGQDLRFSNFSLVPLFEPPLSEQQQIADYLDTKCSEIDALIADKKKQLAILAEYKKSLIYEYVTGKKEVPAEKF